MRLGNTQKMATLRIWRGQCSERLSMAGDSGALGSGGTSGTQSLSFLMCEGITAQSSDLKHAHHKIEIVVM